MLLYFTPIMFHFSLKNNFDDLASLNISLSDFLYSILLGSNSGPKMITPTESNLCLVHMVVGILAISCVNRVSFCQCSRPVAPRRLHCHQKQHNGRGELGGYSFFFLPNWQVSLLRCKEKTSYGWFTTIQGVQILCCTSNMCQAMRSFHHCLSLKQ